MLAWNLRANLASFNHWALPQPEYPAGRVSKDLHLGGNLPLVVRNRLGDPGSRLLGKPGMHSNLCQLFSVNPLTRLLSASQKYAPSFFAHRHKGVETNKVEATCILSICRDRLASEVCRFECPNVS